MLKLPWQQLLSYFVCYSLSDSSWKAKPIFLFFPLLFRVQKMEKMFSAFTGQTLEKVQEYTERDSFLSVSEVI